jgi:hypothetical protein
VRVRERRAKPAFHPLSRFAPAPLGRKGSHRLSCDVQRSGVCDVSPVNSAKKQEARGCSGAERRPQRPEAGFERKGGATQRSGFRPSRVKERSGVCDDAFPEKTLSVKNHSLGKCWRALVNVFD